MKKVLLTVAFFVICLVQAFSSPAAIDFLKLPRDEKFIAYFQDFIENSYDSLRNADINKESKVDLLKKTENFYSYLQSIDKKDYDLLLLKLLLMRCLYNYDVISSAKIEEEVDYLNKNFPKKAEHHWIYGNFLVTSGKNVQGCKEIEKYMDMKDGMVNVFLIEDYACAQMMGGKYLNALYTLTNGGTIPEEEIENQALLKRIKINIEDTSVTESYEQKDVWKITRKQDDGYRYVCSTMLGISVPCKENWKLNLTPYTPGSPVICNLGINDYSVDGHSVGINMLVSAYTDSIFNDSVKKKILKTFPKTKKEKIKIGDNKFEKYTLKDLSKYNDIRKGFKGYVYVSKIVPDQFSGAGCEFDVDLQNLEYSGTGKFYHVRPSKKRFAEPLYIVIVVDSCMALEKETSDIVAEILSKSVFE